MKKRVYYIWLIVLLILYLLLQNTFLGAMFLALVCMGGCSVFISMILSKKVDIQLLTDTVEVQSGEKIYISLRIRNNTIFPTNKMYVKLEVKNFFFDEKDICDVYVPVVIKGEQIINASISCKYVGSVNIKLLETTVGDYLGLVNYTKKLGSNININVMPMDSSLNMKWSSKSVDEEDGNGDAIECMEAYDIKEVREYRDGESLRRVHWNLSARFDDIMVKEFEVETISRFNIMLDLARESQNVINELMEALFGAINILLGIGKEFNVYWYDDGIDSIREKTISDKMDIDDLVDEIYASRIADKAGLVYHNYEKIDADSENINAVIITADTNVVEGEIVGEYNNKVVLKCI